VKVKFAASEAAFLHLESLEGIREELLLAQKARGLDFPCPLDPLLSGVAQCWLAGFSWRELVETTSLDQVGRERGREGRRFRGIPTETVRITHSPLPPSLPPSLLFSRVTSVGTCARSLMPCVRSLSCPRGWSLNDSRTLPEKQQIGWTVSLLLMT
jgi:hypothetical protein